MMFRPWPVASLGHILDMLLNVLDLLANLMASLGVAHNTCHLHVVTFDTPIAGRLRALDTCTRKVSTMSSMSYESSQISWAQIRIAPLSYSFGTSLTSRRPACILFSSLVMNTMYFSLHSKGCTHPRVGGGFRKQGAQRPCGEIHGSQGHHWLLMFSKLMLMRSRDQKRVAQIRLQKQLSSTDWRRKT
jgi:hypothetical protein